MRNGSGQLILRLCLIALCLTCAATTAHAEPKLHLLSKLNWAEDAPWFGGFSGAEVSEDGQTITLISDRGTLVTAQVARRPDGAIDRFSLQSHHILWNGTDTPGDHDAEGLARTGDGTFYLSAEHDHHVAHLDVNTGQIATLPRAKNFAAFQPNSGIEALAAGPDGALYAIPERSGKVDRPFPVFRFKDGVWSITHHIPRHGPFLPVGADIGPDGLFYLLERAATPLGFRSRIRRFDLSQTPLRPKTLLSTGPARFDNLEAISVWRDPAGTIRLLLVSDDNFLSIQHTQIIEYALTE
ncbi:esterase-like activity of phytase family protein [Sulfitobacter mediterraneus]|uniref:esterase-like activity of phytase family protein n=1 Tax=Sulfitobacter mediterraneus TaxID=83219 RepID=UPI000EA036CE|nr:esterase-like activity of phytase family protein [Sulfitobacter mediterraneus]